MLELFNFGQIRIPYYSLNKFLKIDWDSNSNITETLKKSPEFLEALSISTPEFAEITKNSINEGSLTLAIKKTLLKYFSRMSSRSTPFGLFAGVNDVFFNESNTSIELLKIKILKDFDIEIKNNFYSNLVGNFPERIDIKDLIFFTNNSIIDSKECFYYFERENTKFILNSIQKNSFINQILKKAQNGVPFKYINEKLIKLGLNDEDSFQTINDLFQSQILYTNLNYKKSETSKEFLERLKIDDLFSEEIQINSNTKKLNIISKYETFRNSINKESLLKIVNEISDLKPLLIKTKNENLEKFKVEFVHKYGEKLVAINEVFEPDSGIKYGKIIESDNSKILAKLEIKEENNKKNQSDQNDLLFFIFKKMTQNKSDKVNIEEWLNNTKNDISIFDFPPSFSLLGSIYSDGFDDFDEGHCKFYVKNCGGNSALSLISRFALGDEKSKKNLQEIVDWENEYYSDCLVAEINHIPEGPGGNATCHPVIRSYEISYLAAPNLANNRQISINDLYLNINQNDDIFLWSKKYNKRVIPKLSNAHNFTNGLPIYKFLCDIQSEKEDAYFSWNWGFLKSEDFLPRVEFKSLILARARWNLNLKNLDSMLKIIPKNVLIIEGDNELLVDSTQQISIEIIKDLVKKNESLVIEEFLQNDKNAFLALKEEYKTNEIVIPLRNRKEFNKNSTNGITWGDQNQNFHFGSSWIYLKMYCDEKNSEKTILKKLYLFILKHSKNNTIKNWFFIRYYDPHFHLRIRIKTENEVSYYSLIEKISILFKSEIEKNTINKIIFDSYYPEISRYKNIEISEKIFCLDSDITLLFLNKYTFTEQQRITIGILKIKIYLDAIELNIDDKINFCLINRDFFIKETGEEKELKGQLNKIYRENNNEVFKFLDEFSFLEKNKIQQFSKQLKSIISNENNHMGLVHMAINRLFETDARKYEMVCYHYYYKFLCSFKAKTSI